MQQPTILLTGGAGYIGSHTAVQLLNANYHVIVLDNLINSSSESIARVEKITQKKITFIQGDVRHQAILEQVFNQYNIDAVIHFAGLKAVGESTKKPLEYYDVNVGGTIQLCQAMQKAGIFKLVFSSSATVYGDSPNVPFSENQPTQKPTNPYGHSKLMVEEILQDLAKADKRWAIGLLRYFNPIGAHSSGLIGEDPNGIPNNLLPFVSQVAIGKLPKLSIFGDDYPTKDGTGVRDYIHVCDLANGHLAALQFLLKCTGSHIWNLGTGQGYSVLDIVKTFEQVANKSINYQIMPRRSGDIATCYAHPEKAERELNWQAQCSLTDMITDTWNWQQKNPNGYKTTI